MSRKKNQKIKTLMVLDILRKHKGEINAISTKELLQKLEEEEIPCDRRTLINDIETLSAYITDNTDYDFYIRLKTTSKGNAYYTVPKSPKKTEGFTEKELISLISGINSLRMTEDIEKKSAERIKKKLVAMAPEDQSKKLSQYAADDSSYPLDTVAAKILIDSINSLTFMKGSSSNRIIDTIINLSDKDDKKALISEKNNPIYGKHSSESITLYEIDRIFRAIDSQTKISFRYFDLDENLNKIYRLGGSRYIVEPLTLTPNDNHYYLLCYDESTEGKLRTYRIDRMTDVDVKNYSESISEAAKMMKKTLPAHTNQIFRMYNGPVKMVTLEFSDKLIGNIFDKFGTDVKIVRTGEHTCRITEEVQISPPFLGWLFQFTGDMKLVSPRDVIERYTNKCASICGFESLAE